jgi:RHS repeat-associated protein
MLTGLGIDEVFSRTDSTGTRTFLTDALGSTLALTDESGTEQTTTTYTWDPTGLGTVENVFEPAGLAEQVNDTSQTAQFASADALGSIRVITDGSGSVVGSGSYSAWGTPDSGSVTLGGFGFTGEQLDPETGFVHLRNRFYDPTTSRFLTPDPVGALGSGLNLYDYVGNNPATLTDPSG